MYKAYCEEGDFDFGTFVDESMKTDKDKMIISMYKTYCEEGDFDFGTFVDDTIKTDERNQEVTRKMGYISNVEDARRKLEDLFKDT